ncbi:hypothetical protein OF83DRAFT_165185 [Amylostereum chailletii]|nr:hypothetical protein OF83DRAFT_165185 [Amylostereum chailletii]
MSASPKLIEQSSFMAASNIIELISSQSTSTSTLFVYDLAEQVGFGSLSKVYARDQDNRVPVISLQTRAGAGLSLVGRLSQSTSQDGAKGSVLTAYTTPIGLAGMIPSLIHLPTPTVDSRVILQVPTVTAIGDKFSLSPTLAPLNPALSLLPDTFTVLLSATPQKSIDLAAAAYQISSHVIHLFDHSSTSREVGPLNVPPFPAKPLQEAGVQGTLREIGYDFFDYIGDKRASTVVVCLNGPMALAAKSFAFSTPGFGVLVVRVLRPWDEAAFRNAIPLTVQRVHVIEDVPTGSAQGILYADVFGALFEPAGAGPSIYSQPLSPERSYEYLNEPHAFSDLLSSLLPAGQAVVWPLEHLPASKLVFFSTPGTPMSTVPEKVEKTFASSTRISSRILTEYDVFSKPGGVTLDRVLLSPKDSIFPFTPLPFSIPLSPRSDGTTNFLAILDQALLKSHSVLHHAKPRSIVLVVTSWSASELVSNLPSEAVAVAKERHLRICIIDAKTVASKLDAGNEQKNLQSIVAHLAFLRLYFGARGTEAAVLKVAQDVYGPSVAGHDVEKVNAHTWTALAEIDLSEVVVEDNNGSTLRDFGFNAIAISSEDGEPIVNGAKLGSWHDAAKHLLFPTAFTPPVDPSVADEEYPQIPSLRPELPDRTFLVTCSVNRRLTPLEYDRNVFHLEFDTSGTGLKYAIGEALGVHGWNDEQEVADFCQWYGVDPSRLITIPVPGDEGKVHTRTVQQALQQQIDLFGKPPKSFYSDLASFATSSTDKHSLQFIGSAEGSSTFKKLSEKDTVTFADILRRYTSARPGIEVLCEMIGDTKPRHYSIASAQSVVGDRVDLLVVTVEWVEPSGSPRYGQCTRYLAGLKVGQKVTVSIKPSVMKLPKNDMQPLIMAGLGTGAAPFRAFLQHRAMLAEKNLPVGPAYYYFGSRHQSQEYLYGEEIEAFIESGVISRAGLAFSRDGPKKVYIQQKMLEDAETLARMLRQEDGVFYLCGPTWPVPDVFEALRSALVKHHNLDAQAAADFLEGLKEEERYVLEVY